MFSPVERLGVWEGFLFGNLEIYTYLCKKTFLYTLL
jgi:hypothetical protein